MDSDSEVCAGNTRRSNRGGGARYKSYINMCAAVDKDVARHLHRTPSILNYLYIERTFVGGG